MKKSKRDALVILITRKTTILRTLFLRYHRIYGMGIISG